MRTGHAAVVAVALLAVHAAAARAQGADGRGGRGERSRLFDSTSVLEFALVADFRQIRGDRRAENAPYRPATIVYRDGDATVTVPVRVRPRGIWRRAHCEIPPLRLNFARDSVRGTVFARQNRLRLVMHCRNNDAYESYVVQEQLLYRVHNLLTPLSYRSRLAKIAYVDAARRDTIARRYAFLLEEDEAVADRAGGRAVETKGAGPQDLAPFETALFGVWQYFIGNTDFSVAGLHNVLLVNLDSTHLAIAYDFDFSGAVSSSYAVPPPQLPIKHVSQRIMRGYCVAPEHFARAFALFQEKRPAIDSLYRAAAGTLLSSRTVDRTLGYFADFYELIGDPRRARREIIDECLPGPA